MQRTYKMKGLKITALFLALILILGGLMSCKNDSTPRSRTYYEYFDTVSSISSYANDSEKVFEENADAVSLLLSDYHRLFDIYHEYSGWNNLKTVNDNAGKAPVKVDKRLIDFLLYAIDISERTGGKTNIAIGALTSLWHDKREEAKKDPSAASLPSEEALQEAGKHISTRAIIIDRDASTVYISDPHTKIDVGALGKGYAAERAAELLYERGALSYVLNLGGNIRIVGSKPDGSSWATGITDPDKSSDSSIAFYLDLADTSCVTSGSYERYYTYKGKSYHHIIDPSTLYPAEYFTSVTVICKDAALADALSTALFCMSYEEGYAMLSEFSSAEAVWIYADGSIKMTDGAQKLVIS